MVKLRKKSKKDGYLISFSPEEIEALGWKEGDKINKCFKGNKVVLSVLQNNVGDENEYNKKSR